MLKTITKIERDSFILIENPDLVYDYKQINIKTTVWSGERSLYFGELKINEPLIVYGELDVLRGSLIIDPPQSLSYSNILIPEGQFYSQVPSFSSTGNYYFYIYPLLPSGLSLNTSTGEISGTPSVTITTTKFFLSIKNEAGKIVNEIDITIGITPFNLSYNPFRLYVVNESPEELSAVATLSIGTAPITYSISPSLPSGLSFNTSTGEISGTPTESISTTSFVVTATNVYGNTNVSIVIESTDFLLRNDITANSVYYGSGVVPPSYDIDVYEGVILTIEESI